jgi:hypothetical protein
MDPETPAHQNEVWSYMLLLIGKPILFRTGQETFLFWLLSPLIAMAFWNKVIIWQVTFVSKFHFLAFALQDPPLCSSTVASLLKHHIGKNHLCPRWKTTFTWCSLFRILFLFIRIFPERSARCCFWRLILSNETGANRPKLFSRPYLSLYEKNTGISRVKYGSFTFWRTVTHVLYKEITIVEYSLEKVL